MGKVKAETINMFGPEFELAHIKKDTMRKALNKGCRCPVCDQFVKVYSRTINCTMARQLIAAYKEFGVGQFFHVSKLVLPGSASAGDFPKLLHWGLIQGVPHAPGEDAKRTAGLWAVTQAGSDFINDRLTVPKYAVLYNTQLLELTGEEIGIQVALGKKFDYNELMAPAMTSARL